MCRWDSAWFNCSIPRQPNRPHHRPILHPSGDPHLPLAERTSVLLVATIISSYESIPAFGASVPGEMGEAILRLSQNMFILGLKLAAPVLVIILLINILLALLGRAVSQINVFVLSFPVTIAGGLAVMSLSAPFVTELLVREIERLQFTIDELLRALGHG